jgi:hypothetical protein
MFFGHHANNTKSRKIISLAISFLLILSVMANIAYTVNDGNIALAQSPLQSQYQSLAASSLTTVDNNNTNTSSSKQI